MRREVECHLSFKYLSVPVKNRVEFYGIGTWNKVKQFENKSTDEVVLVIDQRFVDKSRFCLSSVHRYRSLFILFIDLRRFESWLQFIGGSTVESRDYFQVDRFHTGSDGQIERLFFYFKLLVEFVDLLDGVQSARKISFELDDVQRSFKLVLSLFDSPVFVVSSMQGDLFHVDLSQFVSQDSSIKTAQQVISFSVEQSSRNRMSLLVCSSRKLNVHDPNRSSTRTMNRRPNLTTTMMTTTTTTRVIVIVTSQKRKFRLTSNAKKSDSSCMKFSNRHKLLDISRVVFWSGMRSVPSPVIETRSKSRSMMSPSITR